MEATEVSPIASTSAETCGDAPAQGNGKPGTTSAPKFTDVIVAVHGIGQQKRFETVRSVATQLAEIKALRGHGKGQPVVPQPLGYFHSDVKNLTSVCLVDDLDVLKDMDLAQTGFAEVFWADIPEMVVREGRTLDETKAWARTVVARANALCLKAAEDKKNNWIVPPDFTLACEVLEEIIDAVYVLENLTFLAEKAGLFKFDLRQVLVDYIGDVQLVTEFTYYRTEIIGRFHQAMWSIYKQCAKANPDVRIHIVAHSEGTVVSFLGLLHAMSKEQVLPAGRRTARGARVLTLNHFANWLHHVHGFMTIGSPIDKHLLLWPRLWTKLTPELANGTLKRGQIRWRNYYDYGDPVGFKLDSARLWLAHQKCECFQFCGCKDCHHDIGFARYPMPGAAHNEYWQDSAVFEHFIGDAVQDKDPKPNPPGDRWWVKWFSPWVPFVFSLLLLAGGVFVLFKAIGAYLHPNTDAFQRYIRFRELGVQISPALGGWELLRAVMGMTALIAGSTLLARLPRLAVSTSWPEAKLTRILGWFKRRRQPQLPPRLSRFLATQSWEVAGVLTFVLGCLLYVWLIPKPTRDQIGSGFARLNAYVHGQGPTLGMLGLAALAGISGYFATARGSDAPNRRQRLVRRGARPLLCCGAVAVIVIVGSQLRPSPISDLGPAVGEAERRSSNALFAANASGLSAKELQQLVEKSGTNWLKTLQNVGPVLKLQPPVWPVLLSGAAFLYLWWLAMIIFDLSFIWQRYIRHSTVNERLREWNSYGLSRKPDAEEQCCNPDRAAG